ncbi:unnamed protein product [Didymodactylos carnosus]|uniref:Uncharacterized protein n=1 Tax=Didymodactylos carnosus TaxID=1234261 RepID=A0A815ZN58_9BILA|nr:unnamed protein product [Didymodactylos carnosus]CAF4453209.1 unnamed protein product [Didymodactylos carnosus]
MNPLWHHLPVDRASTPKILSDFPRTSTPIKLSKNYQSPKRKKKHSPSKQICRSPKDIRASSTQCNEHKHRKQKEKLDLKCTINNDKILKKRKSRRRQHYARESETLPFHLYIPSRLHYITTSTTNCYRRTDSCTQYSIAKQQPLVKIWVV